MRGRPFFIIKNLFHQNEFAGLDLLLAPGFQKVNPRAEMLQRFLVHFAYARDISMDAMHQLSAYIVNPNFKGLFHSGLKSEALGPSGGIGIADNLSWRRSLGLIRIGDGIIDVTKVEFIATLHSKLITIDI